MRAGTHMGRGSNGRRPSAMLYVRDAEPSIARDYPPLERLAREIGVRVNERGTIWLIDPGGHDYPWSKATLAKQDTIPYVRTAAEVLDADISVTCWCEAVIVSVPLREVRAGKTRSCYRKGCSPLALPPRRAVDSSQNGAATSRFTNTGGTFT